MRYNFVIFAIFVVACISKHILTLKKKHCEGWGRDVPVQGQFLVSPQLELKFTYEHNNKQKVKTYSKKGVSPPKEQINTQLFFSYIWVKQTFLGAFLVQIFQEFYKNLSGKKKQKTKQQQSRASWSTLFALIIKIRKYR